MAHFGRIDVLVTSAGIFFTKAFTEFTTEDFNKLVSTNLLGFLYIAQLLGHSGLGLDVDYVPMFADITRLLGVSRVIRRIRAFDPLPELGAKFDLVTAFMICFNNHKQTNLWAVAEWEFFLDDLARHLAPRGRVWLELNREYDGTSYTPELKTFFQRRGAMVDEHKIIFTSGLPAPALTLPVAR